MVLFDYKSFTFVGKLCIMEKTREEEVWILGESS